MKTQRITLIILLVVSALLALEFVRSKVMTKPKSEKVEESTEKEEENTVQDTNKTPKVSAADSIAKLYAPSAFKDNQLKIQRVKSADKEKREVLNKLYKEKNLDEFSLELYFRAFKEEKIIEVWARDKNKPAFLLLKTFDICNTSGELGPKRKEGDKQIPEGFYRFTSFNPESQYFLSLKINYPNRSDEILGDTSNIGGEIYVHGDCVTVGCIPITDDKIKELYLMAVDAKAAGQKKIPITIFPLKLTEENFNKLKEKHSDKPQLISLWKGLKDGYLLFNQCKKLPNITITSKGEYICKSGC